MAATFRNRIALFLWGFAAVWLTGLVAMTYVVLRDGPPPGASVPVTALVMTALWMCGMGLGAFVATKPCFLVTFDQEGRVTATWRYPHKTVRRVLPATSVEPATVVASQDSEGAPYFHARVTSSGGEVLDIAEGHDRSRCVDACQRFNLALQQSSRRSPDTPSQ